jgi:predicted nucleotidyltransferase
VTDRPAANPLFDVLARCAFALRERGVPFALVGGLAISVRVEPRFTRDIDIAVGVEDDTAAEALVTSLVAAGYTLDLSLEQRALNRLAAVRLTPPDVSPDGIVIDLLFASCGIEGEICAAAELIELAPQLQLPVATTGHLLVMKVLARSQDRPQDGVDVQGLLRTLTDDERGRARDAADAIERQGANRGKALRLEIDALLG